MNTIDNIEDFIRLDKRIDTLEDDAADSLRESLRDRWEFGRLMLARRKGKQLPRGVLDELCQVTGKSRAELKFRAQFAERYPTNTEVATAVATFKSWNEARASLPKPPAPQPKPAPIPHAKRDEILDLLEQGIAQSEIVDKVGLSKSTVCEEIVRDRIARDAKAEVTAINWDSLPKTAKAREGIMRRAIRRELEAELEPRIQAEVNTRVGAAQTLANETYTEARRVLDGRKGIITRDEYDMIRSCLHPDSRLSATDAKLANAFQVFTDAEILFLSEKHCPTRTLPSFEDLLKQRPQRRRT